MGEKDKPVQCPKCYTVNIEDSQFCSKCGSALEEALETLSYTPTDEALQDELIQFQPGDVFDNRYRIVEEIGRGGMGRVYKAEDTELSITVALKFIRPKFSLNPIFVERFKKETLTARSISHEHVIRIHDFGDAEKIKYISMEYIKGQNLGELIQASGSLTIETAVNMTKQMCEALKTAHHKGIVHQDLKPSNIMIDNSGQAYIMDFGLAKSLYIQDAALSGRITGTPQYMSPEQAKREKVDQRSDIYSLGIMMYEMLTGKTLFDADTREDYMEKHINEFPKSPSSINPNIPHLLENIVLKCLEKDRNKRYQNAEEIISELDKLIIEPKPLSLTKSIQRYWYVPLIAVLLFFIAASIYLSKKAPPASFSKEKRMSLAIMYLMNNTGDKSLDYMGKTFSELLISDLLQSQHIRVITGDRLYDILKKMNLIDASNYSTNDLKQVAVLGGVDYILQGHITRGGEMLRINTSLHRADTLEPIGAAKVEGKGEESLFTMVDGLTREIKEDFNLSPEDIARDIDKDVMTITTNSPEALKHYIEGKLLYRERKFQESIHVLEKAIELDPEFALAYVKISEDYYYLADVEQGNKYLTKALSLLNKVSEREYYLIQAYAAFTTEMEMENYQKLLELYPDDLEANGYLASKYRNMEEWDLARERFEKLVEIDPNNELNYENLANIYEAKGLYEKARKILESHQHLFSNLVSYHVRLGTTYLAEGKFDQAFEEAEKALSIESDSFEANELLGHIHHIRGNFESAENVYSQMIDGDYFVSQYMGHLWQSHLYLMRGEYERLEDDIVQGLEYYQKLNFKPGLFNFKILRVYIYMQKNFLPEALQESNEAVESANEGGFLAYKNSSLHFRGLVYVKMNKLIEARETAERLKQKIEESGRNKLLRHYYHLIGEIARAEEDILKAIDDFEVAVSLLSAQHFKTDVHIFYLDSLASAYYESGNLEKAKREYENITALTTGRLRWGDKYPKAFYWLGKICQIQGNNEKAIEHYNKFLEIWSNADPDLPEALDARKQLEALEEVPRS